MSNPTDTNQASELFELCKEVYERTGWKPTDWQHGIEDGQPIYTSDYLLEKLPGLLGIDNKTFSLAVQAQVAPPDFVALYTHTSVVAGKLAGHSTRYINVADTPRIALLKLTIALSEAGELK
jgi:hypothetical protein